MVKDYSGSGIISIPEFLPVEPCPVATHAYLNPKTKLNPTINSIDLLSTYPISTVTKSPHYSDSLPFRYRSITRAALSRSGYTPVENNYGVQTMTRLFRDRNRI